MVGTEANGRARLFSHIISAAVPFSLPSLLSTRRRQERATRALRDEKCNGRERTACGPSVPSERREEEEGVNEERAKRARSVTVSETHEGRKNRARVSREERNGGGS